MLALSNRFDDAMDLTLAPLVCVINIGALPEAGSNAGHSPRRNVSQCRRPIGMNEGDGNSKCLWTITATDQPRCFGQIELVNSSFVIVVSPLFTVNVVFHSPIIEKLMVPS